MPNCPCNINKKLDSYVLGAGKLSLLLVFLHLSSQNDIQIWIANDYIASWLSTYLPALRVPRKKRCIWGYPEKSTKQEANSHQLVSVRFLPTESYFIPQTDQ